MLKRNDFKQFRIRFSFCLSMIYPENRRPPFRIMLYAATDPLFVGAYARTVAVTDRDRMLRSDRDLVDDNSGRTGCRQSGHRGDEDAAFHDESPCSIPKNAWFYKQRPRAGPVSGAPQLKLQFNPAAVAASVELTVTCGDRFLSPKSKIAPTRSCYPTPSNSGSFGQRGPNAGAGRRGTRHEPRRSQFHWSCLFLLPVPPEDKPPERLPTVLLPMQLGDIWRVQIVWPNGSVHYFGMFASKASADEWISAHAWLTVRPKRRDDGPG
jgi:hypothetical protein